MADPNDVPANDAPDCTCHVRLTDEAVFVWRPVKARRNPDGSHLICPRTIPLHDVWESQPGQTVVGEIRSDDRGNHIIATRLIDD